MTYRAMITRREGLAWIAAAAAAMPLTAKAQAPAPVTAALPMLDPVAPWPTATLPPVTAAGYGSDPDLMNPKAPWPLILSDEQKALAKLLCDLILPKDDASPGAGEVGVADFIDEWVSAPYPTQSDDRDLILRGLAWLDAQAGAGGFAAATPAQQTRILDAIALSRSDALGQPSSFFSRFKTLVICGYYTLPEGKAALGYIGNQPVVGPYPGPTPEAMDHFHALLASLNLKDPGQPWQAD